MNTDARERVTRVDAGSIALAVTGVLCGNLIGLPPDAQYAQLVLLSTGLTAIMQVIRDRRAAARHETVRTVRTTGKRLAGSAAVLGFLVVPVALYVSAIPGHGWIAIGLLLVGMGMSAPLLVENRKTGQADPGGSQP